MTASAMKGDRELCLDAGMNDYVSKPIRIQALTNALSKIQSLKEKTTDQESSQPDNKKRIEPEKPPILPDSQPEHTQPEAKAPQEGVLDPAALAELQESVGDDPEFLIQFIDTFLGNAPQLLAGLRQALEQEDAARLRLKAHTLKSNSAEFGATTLTTLFRDLENKGQAGTLVGAAELIAQAEAEYEQAKAALEAIRNNAS
jgi:HPt (histidine-containing phosphotransfer) domain-containing protein